MNKSQNVCIIFLYKPNFARYQPDFLLLKSYSKAVMKAVIIGDILIYFSVVEKFGNEVKIRILMIAPILLILVSSCFLSVGIALMIIIRPL